jgi:hypothetical protein
MDDLAAFVLDLVSMQFFRLPSMSLHCAALSPFEAQQFSREDIKITHGEAPCSTTGFFTRNLSSFGSLTALLEDMI